MPKHEDFQPYVSTPVGTLVHYWTSGDLTNHPEAGILLKVSRDGVARIKRLPASGGWTDDMVSVYHVSDPHAWLPEGRPSTSSKRHGLWDYHPWMQPPREVELPFEPRMEKLPNEGMRHREKVQKVHAWAKDHDLEQVARKARGLGFSTEQVKEILSQPVG